jgi:hypothetical protein
MPRPAIGTERSIFLHHLLELRAVDLVWRLQQLLCDPPNLGLVLA